MVAQYRGMLFGFLMGCWVGPGCGAVEGRGGGLVSAGAVVDWFRFHGVISGSVRGFARLRGRRPGGWPPGC